MQVATFNKYEFQIFSWIVFLRFWKQLFEKRPFKSGRTMHDFSLQLRSCGSFVNHESWISTSVSWKKNVEKKKCIQIEKKECKFASLRIWNEKRDRIYKKIVNSIILENGENFYLIALSKQLANISTFLKITVHNSLFVHIHIRCSFFLLLRQH